MIEVRETVAQEAYHAAYTEATTLEHKIAVLKKALLVAEKRFQEGEKSATGDLCDIRELLGRLVVQHAEAIREMRIWPEVKGMLKEVA